MRKHRPRHESDYLLKAVGPTLAHFRAHPGAILDFLNFAAGELPESSPQMLNLRLYHTMRGGRPPSAVLLALLLAYRAKEDLRSRKPKHRAKP